MRLRQKTGPEFFGKKGEDRKNFKVEPNLVEKAEDLMYSMYRI